STMAEMDNSIVFGSGEIVEEGTVSILILFFFNDTATTEIYTLSLHDALPIFLARHDISRRLGQLFAVGALAGNRSEEHTSELQSRSDLVCRLLLEKKKKT